MEKNFDAWNIKKKVIHTEKKRPFFHVREIWWCALGVNVGFEQDGIGENFERPIIVMQGFNKDLFLGAALTTKRKEGKYYFPIGSINGKDSFVILSQVRLIDAKRLMNKIGTIDKKTFEKLKSAMEAALFK
jgi:mRNA interferase MazF